MSMQCFIRVKVNFDEKKSRSSHWKISISTGQEYNHVTKPYYPFYRSIIYEVVAYGKLKIKENFKLVALNVVGIAYDWSGHFQGKRFQI